MERIRLINECALCDSPLKDVNNLVGGKSTWFAICINVNCMAISNAYFEPTDYQLDFLEDDNIIVGYFGGFGAGKTTSAGLKSALHAFDVAGGETLLGAATWTQMLKTNVKELAEIIPQPLVEAASVSLKPSSARFDLLLKNGHRIWATVFDDEGKLRSLNLTSAWMEEASETKQAIFYQLLTRLRSKAGVVYIRDEEGKIVTEEFVASNGKLRTKPKEGKPKYALTLSSNPDPGWIRTEVLYKTEVDKVKYYGNDKKIENQLRIDKTEKNPFISTYVVPTYANYHLPSTFIPVNTNGKSKDWIDRYINGSFSYAEGLVYPTWQKSIVEPFEIPDSWRRIISSDFGRVEATTHLLGAIDPENDILYLYGEYKKGNNTSFMDHIDGFWGLYSKVPRTSWMFAPIGDPAGQTKGQTDRRSWFDLYAEHGIFYIPSRTGKSSEYGISDGITLVNEYLEAGKLKIFSNMAETIDEIGNYRYKTVDLMSGDDFKKRDENPIAYKDHIMDALRGMVSMLPRDVGTKISEKQTLYKPRTTVWDSRDNDEHSDHPLHPNFWKPVVAEFGQSTEYMYDSIFQNDNTEISEEDLYGF